MKKRALRKRYGRATSAMTRRFEVTRVRLDSGGYDSGGRYYGSGPPLFHVYDKETEKEETVRAADAKSARQKVMTGIFGPPPKNSYMGEAKAISNEITAELNRGVSLSYKDHPLVQKYREKLNAVTARLRPLTASDPAWEYYDKHMDRAADDESSRHTSYALHQLRDASQMIAGAADRLKT
jgi:hypothetical protein